MGLALVGWEESRWLAFRRFVATHWKADHPILDRGLFRWQYGGPSRGEPAVWLAVDGSDVVGFLGTIPADYVVPGRGVVPGCALAMWMVAPELRRLGVGVHLLRAAVAGRAALTVLGANAEAGAVYQRLGWSEIPSLTRWVVPLSAGWADVAVDGRSGSPVATEAASARSVALDPERCAALWSSACGGEPPAGLHRDAAFYAWRYRDAVGFRYVCLESEGGVVIGRLEQAENEARTRVMRIVELLPDDPGALRAGRLPDSLVPAALAWGREQGAAAADFQISGEWWADGLGRAGMLREGAEPSLGRVFRPWRPHVAPINAWVRGGGAVGDWLLLKSDGDMDRWNDPFQGSADE